MSMPAERITRLVAKHLKLSVKERFFLEDAVRMHLRPGYLSNFKRPSEKAIFRYLRDTKDEAAGLAILSFGRSGRDLWAFDHGRQAQASC